MGIDSTSSAQSKCVGDGVVVDTRGAWVPAGSISGGSSSLSCRRAEHEPCSSGSGSMTGTFGRHGCLSLGGAVCDVAVLHSGLHVVWVLVLMTVGQIEVV